MKTYSAIGLMSGTSLDGLDIVLCSFKKKHQWHYEIIEAETIEYTQEWQQDLKNLMTTSAIEFVKKDLMFARFCATEVNKFIRRHKTTPDFIASHGHTVFHAPNHGYTTQIGNGAYISALTGLPVVSDFRTIDVGLKGQGAPLVPIGDEYLFAMYDYCLNLGGIANISYNLSGERIAFDICPVNILLNHFAKRNGKLYDKNGAMAKKGIVVPSLLHLLNNLPYYETPPPKSLGKEWIDKHVFPLVDKFKVRNEDILATCTEHIAMQIAMAVQVSKNKNMLITGGGAFNSFLIERIKHYTGKDLKIIIPDKAIIKYKEALIFAFLGLLKLHNEINILKSVTGATRDSIGGALYGKNPYQ